MKTKELFLFKVLIYSMLSFCGNFAFSSLIKVSSSYTSNTTISNTVDGTGFIIGFECDDMLTNDRYNRIKSGMNSCRKNFLVTAAHLSQGDTNLILKDPITNKNIDYVNRLADNWLDIEIFELNSVTLKRLNILPLLRCTNIYSCYNRFSGLGSNQLRYSIFPENYYPYFWSHNMGELAASRKSNLWKDMVFFPIVLEKPTIDASDEIVNRVYRWTYDNNKIVLPHSIAYGMSGSPLLSNPLVDLDANINAKRLTGVSLQNDFFFRESIFASNVAIGKLLNQYINENKREFIYGSPKWNHGTDSTYRTMNFKNYTIIESQQFRRNTETGGSGRGDMGKRAKESMISSSPLITSETEMFSTDLTIEDFNGKTSQLLGFLYSNNPKKAFWADMPSLGFLIQKNNDINLNETNFIKQNTSLIDLLIEKINTQNTQSDSGVQSGFSSLFSILGFKNEKKSNVVKNNYIENNTCRISISESDGKSEIKVEVNLKTDDSAASNDFRLQFKLNEFGITNDGNIQLQKFSPRIFVTASNNKKFIIDIRQLFFTDLYEINSDSDEGFGSIPDPFEIAKSEGAILKLKELDEKQAPLSIRCLSTENGQNSYE